MDLRGRGRDILNDKIAQEKKLIEAIKLKGYKTHIDKEVEDLKQESDEINRQPYDRENFLEFNKKMDDLELKVKWLQKEIEKVSKM